MEDGDDDTPVKSLGDPRGEDKTSTNNEDSAACKNEEAKELLLEDEDSVVSKDEEAKELLSEDEDPVACKDEGPVTSVNEDPVACKDEGSVTSVIEDPVACKDESPVTSVNEDPVASKDGGLVTSVNEDPVAFNDIATGLLSECQDPVASKDEDTELPSGDEDPAIVFSDSSEANLLCGNENQENQTASCKNEEPSAGLGNDSGEELHESVEHLHEHPYIESECIPADARGEKICALENSVSSPVDSLELSSEGQDDEHQVSEEEGELLSSKLGTDNEPSCMGEEEETVEEDCHKREGEHHKQESERLHILTLPENERMSVDGEDVNHGLMEDSENDQSFRKENYSDEYSSHSQDVQNSALENNQCDSQGAVKSELVAFAGESKEEPSLQSSHGEERSSLASEVTEDEETVCNSELVPYSPSSPESADSSTDSSSSSNSSSSSPPGTPQTPEDACDTLGRDESEVSPSERIDSPMDVDNSVPCEESEGIKSEVQGEVESMGEEARVLTEHDSFTQKCEGGGDSSIQQAPLESTPCVVSGNVDKATSVQEQKDFGCTERARGGVHEYEDSDENEEKDEEKGESMSIDECSAQASPKEPCEEKVCTHNEADHKNETDSHNVLMDNTEEHASYDTSKKVNGEVDLEKDDLLEPLPDRDVTSPGKDNYGVKRKLLSSPRAASPENTSVETVKGNIQYKGFKKRYIAQVSEEEAAAAAAEEAAEEELAEGLNYATSEEGDVIIDPSQVIVSHPPLPDGTQTETPLTEYAQYLGLQPTLKFKCYRCGESGFPSMLSLQEHQSTCLTSTRLPSADKPQPPPQPPPVEPVPSTNFRITRKVYLCSACGTYYENWNLFLHMREVHKRHICLLCLGMFSQADKLAVHLLSKHGITDSLYSSPEQFLDEFKGSFFVMCCTCEEMFTERDHFFDHTCGNSITPVCVDQACSLCGLKGAHFPSCRRAFTDSGSLVTPPASQPVSTTDGNSENAQSSPMKIQDKVFSSEKGTSRKGQRAAGQEPGVNTGKRREGDGFYDISDAASYCHVNLLEPDRQKSNSKGTENQVAVSEESCSPHVETSTRVVAEAETNNFPEQVAEEERKDGQLVPAHDCATSEVIEDENANTTTSTDEHDKRDAVKEAEKSPQLKQSEGHKGDSDSEMSDSGGDSNGSSSSSEHSSEENEHEEKKDKVTEKSVMSDDSGGDKSDSDKMSIVLDESKSEDENASRNQESNAVSSPQRLNESDAAPVNDRDQQQSPQEAAVVNNREQEEPSDNVQVAGEEVPLLELTLEEKMEVLPIQTVVKECVKVSCSSCVYCNHAKKIAVNGKQLVLHLLAEHRFEAVVCSDSAELSPVNGFVEKLKSNLSDLQDMFFNTDTYDNVDITSAKPFDRTYECFHCHYITTLHKDLYLHNRKMHQKTILLCIMCKSNFYSYSELLCHLCPGIYVPDSNILFRCCLCMVDGLPSAFRLMVHLRKKHHACDVCLETTEDQQKLSNHVWKHKLHHLCYRCGIAYRNKPDITKHLFWKHGTESVLCKKCLQKKWPHVYHFCIPPNAFVCEECNATFSRAVALKVHKRLHGGDAPYDCDECEEKFISKRLLKRHKEKHRQALTAEKEPVQEEGVTAEPQEGETSEQNVAEAEKENVPDEDSKKIDNASVDDGLKAVVSSESSDQQPAATESPKNPDVSSKSEKKSKVLDVYDLPPLNLSSESDDSEDESAKKLLVNNSNPPDTEAPSAPSPSEPVSDVVKPSEEISNEDETQPVQIVDGVWDNFKTYKAKLEEREILQAQVSGTLMPGTSNAVSSCSTDNYAIVDVVMADHDYCTVLTKPPPEGDNLQDTAGPDVSSQGMLNQDPSDDKDADHSSSVAVEEKKELLSEPKVEPSPLPEALSPPHPPANDSASTVNSPPKKKQKSPKKKQQKQSGTSSSSDSSSNSDSSSCTCGTNCSCSSSSSSSSGSSSSSSDSDSSSSESRRRQAVRRERRKERAKKKQESSSKVENVTSALQSQPTEQSDSKEVLQPVFDDVAAPPPEPEDSELLIHESDLETTETETDEDFYDRYPQKQANKLLAEKRNQLLMLAAVAPVNNGTMSQPASVSAPQTPEPMQKKKVKTKRHKKAQHNSSEKKAASKLKLNIPVSYYNSPYSNTVTVAPLVPQPPLVIQTSRLPHDSYHVVNSEPVSTPIAYQSTGSGSETDSKRLSKRKRIPKRFYGDSSDEEAEASLHQPYKWRKVTPMNSNSLPPQATAATVAAASSFGYRTSPVVAPAPEPPPPPVPDPPLQIKSEDEDEGGEDSDSDRDAKQSSSDSSNSDSDNEQSDPDSDVEAAPTVTNAVVPGVGSAQQRNENLYCYCQCPYDEVSEMIACDGKDCSIEWFHFECVGIMVPPKGKWFCPDCRKKTAARSEYLLHA